MSPLASSPTSTSTASFSTMMNEGYDWKNVRPQEPFKGVWSEAEHNRFLEAFKLYPQGPWKAITSHIGTRTIRQVQTHAQKYQEKVQRRARGLKTVHPRMIHQDHRIDDEIEPWWTRETGMLAGTPTKTALRRRRRRRKTSDDTVCSSTASQGEARPNSDDDSTEDSYKSETMWTQYEPLPFSPEMASPEAPLPTLDECLAVVNECLVEMASEAYINV